MNTGKAPGSKLQAPSALAGTPCGTALGRVWDGSNEQNFPVNQGLGRVGRLYGGKGGGYRGNLVLQYLAIALLFAVIVPRSAHAHGELLVRIAEMTRQIATNSSPQLYLERGELYREDRNWEAAEADYSRAAELGVAIHEVDYCRARMLVDRGQPAAARTILDGVIRHSERNGKALVARAHALIQLGERKAALQDFERGIPVLSEPEADVFLEWAQALVAEGRVVDGLRRLDEGMSKFGPVNALQVYAMDLEIGQKNTGSALKRLQTIIERADRKERWLARRGEIQLAGGNPIEARQSYEAALGAIRLLPGILQRSPPMLNLKSQINAALATIASSPAAGKAGGN